MSDTATAIILSVPGMSCGHCESAVKAEVGKVRGVASVTVDLDSKDVFVAGESVDVEALIAAVDEAGYEVVSVR